MSTVKYQSGWGNFFESEAVPGALPIGQNSPQVNPKNLYSEQLSGSAFTMPRHENLRSWLYRLQPSVVRGAFVPWVDSGFWRSRTEGAPTNPTPLRWGAPSAPGQDCDFLHGVTTMASNNRDGGCVVHQYQFNQPMIDDYFYNADGELLFIPERGTVLLLTEFGPLEVAPGEIAVVPRGVHFQVRGAAAAPGSSWWRGYLGENSGAPFRLPGLGPLGANGLANPRDFLAPVASYENRQGEFQIFCQFQGHFWRAPASHSPLNVVAWHGNYVPYKYDLRRFNTMGTVSYDHPDPSIYTVLTSPSSVEGRANCDFVVFPPRWLVGENTFRPPYYHRNVMSEYMGLIYGDYDAKEGGGFVPGGASLHNCMSAHGPDAATFRKEIARGKGPHKIENTMAFMLETSSVWHVSDAAMEAPHRDRSYDQCWAGLDNRFEV